MEEGSGENLMMGGASGNNSSGGDCSAASPEENVQKFLEQVAYIILIIAKREQ